MGDAGLGGNHPNREKQHVERGGQRDLDDARLKFIMSKKMSYHGLAVPVKQGEHFRGPNPTDVVRQLVGSGQPVRPPSDTDAATTSTSLILDA